MSRKITLPQWLDGQTIAVLTLLVAHGAMMQVGFMDLRGEIRLLRSELVGEIRLLRCELVGELRQVRGEIGQLRKDTRTEIRQFRTEVRTELHGLDHHLRNAEQGVASIKAGMAQATHSEEVAAI